MLASFYSHQIGGIGMNDLPKYSHVEIERRWLVDLARLGDLSRYARREIDDLYISDSRLRLRRVGGPADEVTFKLGKKYGKRTPLSEPMTNLYLTEHEYGQLCSLPGSRSRKHRYALGGGSLDVYLEPCPGLAVFEVEFPDERSAQDYEPPSFATREITAEEEFAGMSVARYAT
jgi:CYTH domain-containing protein